MLQIEDEKTEQNEILDGARVTGPNKTLKR
jgi:hypothetical protein